MYHGHYRVESIRLPGWDYAQPGWYFVTVCVAERAGMPLGRVVDGTMQWSLAGSIVVEEWCKTEIVRPNVRLDEWVVMPDHLHGIIIIDGGCGPSANGASDDGQRERGDARGRGGVGAERVLGDLRDVGDERVLGDLRVETPRRGVSTSKFPVDSIKSASPHSHGGPQSAWKPGTLGAIINQFKSMCTKRIRAAEIPFAWQPRFYDRVIRHPQELVRVQEYIRANPEKWEREMGEGG
jgi:REP element-mobilizing transposase RayT